MCGQWASEKDELKIDSNSWRANGMWHLRNEGGMLLGPAAPLPFIFMTADRSSPMWSKAELLSSTDGVLRRFLNCGLRSPLARNMLSLLTLAKWLMNALVWDLMFVMVWLLWKTSTVQILDDFLYIWDLWIWHCVFKIFPTFCLGIVDSFGGFTESIDPLQSILMDCPTKEILSTHFCSHVWSHPKFRFLPRFCFSYVSWRSWSENAIEARYN